MKRQRGRGRKPGGGHHNNQFQPNRTLESSGPDVKVRGPASHIYERYLQLARDASSSGDRVLGENYLQHADHYFRMVRAMQPAQPAPQPAERLNADGEMEDEETSAEGGEDVEAAGEAGEQPDVEFPEQAQRMERGEGDFRRRRGRRNRYRPEGGDGEMREGREPRESREPREGGERREMREGGERREPREQREPRDERPASRDNGESGGPEGFSNGPKPAFLRD